MPKFIDLTGRKFNRWTVLRRVDSTTGKTTWRCRCDCGEERDVIGRNLTNGRSSSCGCFKDEKNAALPPRTLVNTYFGAKKRCEIPTDPHYASYGGRGIEFRFRSYAEFYEQLSPTWFEGATLDRVNNDGHYEYGNVRWVSQTWQMENTRVSRLVEYRGVKLSLSKWAMAIGVPRATLYWRFYAGWPVDRILKEIDDA